MGVVSVGSKKTAPGSGLLRLANQGSVWLVAVLLFLLPLVLPEKGLALQILIFGLFALSFNLLFGYTGLLSFGHATLFGLGAYSTALSLIHLKVGLWLALLAGVLVSSIAAFFIGWMSLRRRQVYFAMLTLAFGEMVYFVFFQSRQLTGGDDGLRGVPIPRLEIPGLLSLKIDPMVNPFGYYYFALALVILSMLALQRIVDSPFGLALQAIRESEERARACGYDTNRLQHLSFVFAGFFAGLAGSLNAMNLGFVGLDSLSWVTSGMVVIMSILGGRRTFFGPFIGAGIFLFIEEYVSKYTTSWQIVVGAIFVLCVLLLPEGIWGTISRSRALAGGRQKSPAKVAAKWQLSPASEQEGQAG